VIFVVSPVGPFGPISTPEKERVIRAAISPSRQRDVYVYPGTLADLLAGQTTSKVGNAGIDAENRPYWIVVHSVFSPTTPVLSLQAFAPPDAAGRPVAPGVLLVRGPTRVVPRLGQLLPVPITEVALARAILLALLLGLAGIGWTLWFLGRGSKPVLILSLAPAVGAGVLVLASLVTAKAGLDLGGSAGIATFALVAVAGGAVAVLRRKPVQKRSDG
jgi:hypothetical protein